ncbi:MAG: hypothetical protein AAGB04_00330 [Pseudomonadota bacterium]
MTSALYKIAPLEWSGHEITHKHGFDKSARTPFGSYWVSCEPDGSECKWSYCFDEYYDEDEVSCETPQEGMQLAFEHWCERLAGALTKSTVQEALNNES